MWSNGSRALLTCGSGINHVILLLGGENVLAAFWKPWLGGENDPGRYVGKTTHRLETWAKQHAPASLLRPPRMRLWMTMRMKTKMERSPRHYCYFFGSRKTNSGLEDGTKRLSWKFESKSNEKPIFKIKQCLWNEIKVACTVSTFHHGP